VNLSASAYKDLITSRVSTSGNVWSGKDITVGAASVASVSFLKLYYSAELKRIYPYMMAIIDVKKGVVQGITWDDACVFCGGDECDDILYNYNGTKPERAGQPRGGCFISQQACDEALVASPDQRSICDIVLHVVWAGTDKNGLAFQSSANRFSNFNTQKLQDRLADSLASVGGGGESKQHRRRRLSELGF
jgi:hypothetical protein